jgi:surfeit locus 1 family protein
MITLVGCVLLVGLGLWQLQRLSWKQGLIATMTLNQSFPPEKLLSLLQIAKQQSLSYRHVSAEGVFDYMHELRLVGKPLDGISGSYVLTPLSLPDGQKIYVNRGWIPSNTQKKDLSSPQGRVIVSGFLRDKMSRNFFTPPDNKETHEVFAFDPREYSSFPYFIEAAKIQGQSTLPRLFPQIVPLRNEHLSYAITWFSLAIILMGIFVGYLKGRLRALEVVPNQSV